MPQESTSDSILFYGVGGWAKYGLAVPNPSKHDFTNNDVISYLVSNVGRNLQSMMCRNDAMMTTPPKFETIVNIHKLCTTVRTRLASRAKAPNQTRLSPVHATPAKESFLVFPTPFYKVRNPWLKSYATLTLTAMTEMMQHNENSDSLSITTEFASTIGGYFHEIYKNMAMDLLNISRTEAEKLDFTLTADQLLTYDPTKFHTSTEITDSRIDLDLMLTEDMLAELTQGIPTASLPVLSRYPSNITPQANQTSTNNNASFLPKQII